MSPEYYNQSEGRIDAINLSRAVVALDESPELKQQYQDSGLFHSERELGPQDVEITKKLIQTLSPVTRENYKAHAHVSLTGKIAYAIAEQLGENPDEMYSRGLFHDSGKLLRQYKWGRNDFIGKVLMRKIGLREDFRLEGLDNLITENFGNMTVDEIMDRMSIHDRIIDIADQYGKRTYKPWGALSFKGVREYSEQSRLQVIKDDRIWPSEKLLTQEMVDVAEQYYTKLNEYFLEKGVDVDVIQQNILEEERKAQVKTIAFDVGGVLIKNQDSDIATLLAGDLGCDIEILKQAMDNNTVALQSGLLKESDFWNKFCSEHKISIPENSDTLFAKYFTPEINPDVLAIAKKLKQRGYRLIILSDASPSHRDKVMQLSGMELFDRQIYSADIHATKGEIEPKTEITHSFAITAVIEDCAPNEILFVDDKEKNATNARNMGMKAIHFESPEQLQQALIEQKVLE